MRALFLNCTLKPSPQDSNTERLARVVDGGVLAASPIPAPPS